MKLPATKTTSMKRLRKLRIYSVFLLVFTFSVSMTSCDVMLDILDEMAETEQSDGGSGGGGDNTNDGGSDGKGKGKTDDDNQSKGKGKSGGG